MYAIEAVGAVARLRVLVAGEVVEDRGEPLAQESVLGEHEFAEDAHIALFERLCGLPSGQSLHDLAFHALDGV